DMFYKNVRSRLKALDTNELKYGVWLRDSKDSKGFYKYKKDETFVHGGRGRGKAQGVMPRNDRK
ncbi:hypothetical protein Csa_022549, partial [Cucumis sativus]